ncbi:MAG: hypothetical protein APF80_10650 [Alphaproteobacteria bacterium BRH_c36]|nr:MAG: hypothetical protein APF80_10650 [Alphaproteobacteria bacterium BRH_c36]
MATIITVHGTFAHFGGVQSDIPAPGAEAQWWQRGSASEADMMRLVDGADGPLHIEPFVWNGDNSEIERRRAGRALYRRMKALEQEGEPYCVIGHSHGGSVISSALLEAAQRKQPLSGLKRWVTVGTPFVNLRRERVLFLRLTLLQKAMFVASLMLLLMFAAFIVGEVASGNSQFDNQNWLARYGIYTLLMSLPFALFWAVFKFLDLRKLYFYRPHIVSEARNGFGPRWMGFWHKDDEAVSGLSTIGGLKMQIFHSTFAVPFFSILSVFLLPLLYLLLLTTPGAMVGIADVMRDRVYQISDYEQSEARVLAARQEVRQLRRSLRVSRQEFDNADTGGNLVQRLDAKKKVESLETSLQEAREKMHAENPNLVPVERALRFKRRFLERDGKRCEGGSLCGSGRDIALNSRLLFHLVTDEASSLFLDDDLWRGRLGTLARLILPVILVPIVFGVVAVILVFLVQGIARFLSGLLARVLDDLTWFEIKRSALGNDTETEVALTAAPRPFWLNQSPPSLPLELGEHITGYSNQIAAQSLGKFRNAIGELAFSDGKQNTQHNVFSYLTWRELIHSSYFEVPQFRWLVAESIATAEGFKRGAALEGAEPARKAAAWLEAMKGNG